MAASASPLLRLGGSVLAPRVGVAVAGSPGALMDVLASAVEQPNPCFLNILSDAHSPHVEARLGKLAAGRDTKNVFVATRLQPCRPAQVQTHVKEIQERLQGLALDHLSLPSPFLMPGVIGDKGHFDTVVYLSAWRELERLLRAGAVRSIGVCDLPLPKLRQFLPLCDIRPALLQAEMHPFMPQDPLLDFCKANSIAVAALAPLASYPTGGNRIKTADNTTLGRVARDLALGVPLTLVQWALSRGTIALPRTTSPAHLRENLAQVTSTVQVTVRHGRMLAALNRHQRLHRGEQAATRLGLHWHELWDELPLDPNGIPLSGSPLCTVDELRDGECLGLGYPGALHSPMILVRQGDAVTAFLNRCPHLNTALDSNGAFLDKTGQHIVCSTHGALFRPSDGMCTSGPCAGDSLVRIPTHVYGGHVIMGDPV